MKKNLQRGQWLFTCDMKPQQFGEYIPHNPNDYGDINTMSEESLEYHKYNNFNTMNGSNHSQCNCGCKLISEEYSKWFLKNNINQLYVQPEGNIAELNDKAWNEYIQKVKECCKEDNIKYEGI